MAGAGLSWVTEVSKATSLWGCSVFVDAFVAQRLGVPPTPPPPPRAHGCSRNPGGRGFRLNRLSAARPRLDPGPLTDKIMCRTNENCTGLAQIVKHFELTIPKL